MVAEFTFENLYNYILFIWFPLKKKLDKCKNANFSLFSRGYVAEYWLTGGGCQVTSGDFRKWLVSVESRLAPNPPQNSKLAFIHLAFLFKASETPVAFFPLLPIFTLL